MNRLVRRQCLDNNFHVPVNSAGGRIQTQRPQRLLLRQILPDGHCRRHENTISETIGDDHPLSGRSDLPAHVGLQVPIHRQRRSAGMPLSARPAELGPIFFRRQRRYPKPAVGPINTANAPKCQTRSPHGQLH
jgi:hypothetical protein